MKPKRKPRCWCGRTRKQHEQNPDKCVIGYTEREGGSKGEAGASGSLADGVVDKRGKSAIANPITMREPANPASPTEPTNEQILMMLREAKLSYNEIVRHFYRLNRAEQIKAAEQRGREEGAEIAMNLFDKAYYEDGTLREVKAEIKAALRRAKEGGKDG